MTFVKVPAKSVTSFSNSSFFLEFMKNESIQACFNNNGFIAGGFARALLRGDSLKNYFSPNVSEPRGDVDFFFRSKEDANRAEDTIASSSDFRISPSLGKFATNVTDYRNAVGADFSRFVVQIVNAPELIFPTIEQTLQNFDLVNSQVAFDGESVFFNEDFHRLED